MKNATKNAKSAKSAANAAAKAESAAKRSTKAERRALKAANRARVSGASELSKLPPEAAAIAGSMLCPDAFPAVRFQDGYDTIPTALFEPKNIVEIPFSATAGGVDLLGYSTDEQWLFAYRDPRCGLIVYDHDLSTTTQYQLQAYNGSTVLSRASGVNLSFEGAVYSSGTPIHGNFLFGAYAFGSLFFPLSYCDSIKQLVAGALPASTSVQMAIYTCDGDNDIIYRTITATTAADGTGTWQLSGAAPAIPGNWIGKVAIVNVNAVCTGTTFALNYATNNPVMSTYSMGSFDTVDGSVESFRANGLSLMYTNTAQELYRGGAVVACQVSKSVPPLTLLQAGYAGLAARPGAKELSAENGIQISYRPTSADDMQFIACGLVGLTEVNGYPMNPVSDYLAICIQLPVANMRSGKALLHCNAEGRTNSPWFALTTDRPGDRQSSLLALDLVRMYPQVHENPLHIRDILAFLKSNRRGIGHIAKAVGDAFPVLAPLTTAIGAGLGAL